MASFRYLAVPVAIALAGCDDSQTRYPFVKATCERGGKIVFDGVVKNEPARDMIGDGISMTTREGEEVFIAKVDSCRARKVLLRAGDRA